MNISKNAKKLDGAEVYWIQDLGGKKYIHISAYFWISDENYRITEYTWLMMPVKEFMKLDGDDLDMWYSEVKQYEADIEDEQEWIDDFYHYDDGKAPMKFLSYSEVNMDTPYGCYYTMCK